MPIRRGLRQLRSCPKAALIKETFSTKAGLGGTATYSFVMVYNGLSAAKLDPPIIRP